MVLVVQPQRPGHARQGGQQGAIDGRQLFQGLHFGRWDTGRDVRGQLGDDFLEGVGVEDAGGFAEAAQGGGTDAEAFLDLVQEGGLLEAAQAGKDGVEEVEQQQGGVLVKEELPIAGPVAVGADFVEAFEQRRQQLEILEALEVLGRDLGFFLGRHGGVLLGRHAADEGPRVPAQG